MNNIITTDTPVYTFIQSLGWDYNFWTIIFANIILIATIFGIIYLIGFIGMLLVVYW